MAGGRRGSGGEEVHREGGRRLRGERCGGAKVVRCEETGAAGQASRLGHIRK